MNDIFGQKLEIGDVVAFNPPKYKGLTTGIIIGFTPKSVKIEIGDDYPDWILCGIEQENGKRATIVTAKNIAKYPFAKKYVGE